MQPANRNANELALDFYFTNFIQAYDKRSADLICFHIGSIEPAFSNINVTTPNFDFHYPGHQYHLTGNVELVIILSLQLCLYHMA